MAALRTFTLIAMIGYVLGAILIGPKTPGMKAIIFFSILTFIINIVQLVLLYIEKEPITLPKDIRTIFKNIFPMLTAKQLIKLYKLSAIMQYKQNNLISQRGKPIDNLILIKEGLVEILRKEKHLFSIGKEYFIGEMSFLTGGSANADVKVESENLAAIVWKKSVLMKLEESDPDLLHDLKAAIAINLIKKIDHHVALLAE